jgi:hypothetical protein
MIFFTSAEVFNYILVAKINKIFGFSHISGQKMRFATQLHRFHRTFAAEKG